MQEGPAGEAMAFAHNGYEIFPENWRPEESVFTAKPMMKQPADNPNATPMEERQSAERIRPERDPAEEHAEVQAEAARLSLSRGQEGNITTEDWAQATEIVRNRKRAQSKA